MKHLNEEQLILYFYGEGAARDVASVEKHLASCAECRSQLELLKRDLATVERATPAVPERGEAYGAEVWQQVRPRLDAHPAPALDWRAWFHMPRLAWAGAMATLLVAAFLAGKLMNAPGRVDVARTEMEASATADQVGDRVLAAALGDHLERSQMLLVELTNAPTHGRVDISAEQQWAEDLLDTNRLYRETAASAGKPALTSVLDELERVLVDVATSPKEISPDDLESIRKRIETQNILFKVRVLNSQLHAREQQAIPRPLGKS